ncbi:MAG: arginyl-tRNA synthetase [Pseudonocardiales bacterium]|nr:arginyl-tRNA synthetase [Pseudonocardiales bacterium]
MTPAELSAAIADAVSGALAAGDFVGERPAEVVVDRPKNRDHGDYATNVALRLAKPAGMPPRQVADAIAARLRLIEGIAAVDVAGPGFLNITFAADALGQIARDVVSAGERYGDNDTFAGQKINLEFVSANPTGPVHIGAVRWAAVGDALARILLASGAEVTREYYFNDAGSQIDRFARTLREVANGRPVPEDGYAGTYIDEIADEVVALHPEVKSLTDDEQTAVFQQTGVDLMFAEIRSSLAAFGVQFDVYFNERDLHTAGDLDAALKRLADQGHVFEIDGAKWLRTTEFGDDKDRVLVKADGDWTYFAADAAYYLNKRERGFDKVVIMLGADHHGYVGRYRALVAAYGDDPEVNLEILIGQLVNLVKDGQPVRMSKRAGNVVLLADLVEALGVDATRYALARYSSDQMIDLDIDLWTQQTSDNPVFYVQYAHARLSKLQRTAADLGIVRSDEPDLGLLSHEREAALLTSLAEFPRVVATAGELRAPHRVARYLEQLAGTYHRFYDSCRVLPQGDEVATEVTDARLWLCEATRIVLANGLQLLGVSAPERM